MFRNIFSHVEGITIYPIVAMILFFVIFVGVIIYTYNMKKTTIDYISNLPLENDELSKSKIGE